MEMLNRIELTGWVGNVRITEVGDTRTARISVATDYCYKDRDGHAVIETTWHQVIIWEKDALGSGNLEDIQRGCAINVKGRIRNQRWINVEGRESTSAEVIAYAWKIVK